MLTQNLFYRIISCLEKFWQKRCGFKVRNIFLQKKMNQNLFKWVAAAAMSQQWNQLFEHCYYSPMLSSHELYYCFEDPTVVVLKRNLRIYRFCLHKKTQYFNSETIKTLENTNFWWTTCLSNIIPSTTTNWDENAYKIWCNKNVYL